MRPLIFKKKTPVELFTKKSNQNKGYSLLYFVKYCSCIATIFVAGFQRLENDPRAMNGNFICINLSNAIIVVINSLQGEKIKVYHKVIETYLNSVKEG